MSFSVDLWNGFDAIKKKIYSTNKQIKNFHKFLTNYITYEKQHCTNLDQLYREFKDDTDLDYPLEKSRFNIVNMIDFESKRRKEFVNFVSKNIIEKMSAYLSQPKIALDKLFLDNDDLTLSFNNNINKLAIKQEIFHTQCKEFCSYLSQYELDKKTNNKSDTLKLERHLNRLMNSRQDYLYYINLTNIDRKRYNAKKEELLNELEKLYKHTIEKYKDYLFTFSEKQCNMFHILYEKEKNDYKKYHSNIDLDQELLLFVIKNVTKEFPMTQIEFCPLKSSIIEHFIKTKYNGKLGEKECNQLINSVQAYFRSKNIFPKNLIQTGISRDEGKTQADNIYSSAKKSGKKTKNKVKISSAKKMNAYEEKEKEKEKDKTLIEEEGIILHNIKFIKNTLNELLTNGKVKMFEDNNEKVNEKKDFRESMNKEKKISELLKLINISNENRSVYIETIIKVLSYIRPKGYCELNEFNYNLLNNIFAKILKENPKNDYMIKNLLILSQTFYKIEDDEKIYLQKGIKGLSIFDSPEIWHRCINYSLSLANTDKDLTIQTKKDELINKINKEAFAIVITFLCDLKRFTDDENVYEAVKYFYSEIYDLDENSINHTVEDNIKLNNIRAEKKVLSKSLINERMSAKINTNRNTAKKIAIKDDNEIPEIMKLELDDQEEKRLKTKRSESRKREEIIMENNNNENNIINENEIQQMINNDNDPEEFKENTPKKNFFNFNDSIFTSSKDNTGRKTSSVYNGILNDIIEDSNE